MSRQEKADDLFHRICEHCEEFSTKHKCEIQDTCPVYELFKMAKEKARERFNRIYEQSKKEQ